jgi:hypothetical protein
MGLGAAMHDTQADMLLVRWLRPQPAFKDSMQRLDDLWDYTIHIKYRILFRYSLIREPKKSLIETRGLREDVISGTHSAYEATGGTLLFK